MKKLTASLSCFLLALTLPILADQESGKTSPKTPKAIFIILDGISTDTIQKIETPAIDSISRKGGFSKAFVGGEKNGYSQSPTISAVGYNSLITGTWTHKHNVWGNQIKDPNYHYWNLFRLIHEIAPEKKTAIFSTWEDNRTKLIGHGNEAAGNPKIDYHFDGFEHDTENFPNHGDSENIRKIDAHVAREAARYLKENGPDLSWVYLQYTDDMGHRHGDSPEFHKSIEKADGYVQAISDSIRHRMQTENEDWLIIVTTDHGRDPNTGKHHGGQSDRERSIWISTNASNLNDYFKKQTSGIVDLYPTICRFLKLEIPDETAHELDGVPLIGPVSISNLKGDFQKETESIELTWDAIEPKGELQILVSKTNRFQEGGRDEYRLLQTVPVENEQTTLKIAPSSFYKILLKAPHNTLNRWILR